MPLVNMLHGRTVPQMIIVVAVLPAEEADRGLRGVDSMNPVLAPVTTARKCKHMPLAGCVGLGCGRSVPELSGERPIHSLLRGKHRASLMKRSCNTLHRGLEYHRPVKV